MILHRYLVREIVPPLLAGLAFLFQLLLVLQILSMDAAVFGPAVHLGDIGKTVLFLAPRFLALAMPLAFMLAIMLGVGRLSEDRELVALASVGRGPSSLYPVPVALGLVLTLVGLFLSLRAEPWGMRGIRRHLNAVIKENVAGGVDPKTFYDELPRFTLYAEGLHADKRGWNRLLLHDERGDGAPILILAQHGRVLEGDGGNLLRLQLADGEMHREGESTYGVVGFEQAEIALGVGEHLGRKNKFGNPTVEMTAAQLGVAEEQARAAGDQPRAAQLRSARHERYAQPFAVLAMALLGVPLAALRRGGRAVGYIGTVGAFVVYYLLARVGTQLSENGALPPALAAQVPNLVFALTGAGLFIRAHRSLGVAR